jgi:RHS repeat-associated protein
MGTTTSASNSVTVTVNGTNASVYGDATFAATNMPLTTTYTAIAHDGYGRGSTNVVSVSLSTNVTFQYDGNGNLISDGLRAFTYNDENQLIQVLVTNQWMSQFAYDGKFRRRTRSEFTWTNSTWIETNSIIYFYDGNLVIQERSKYFLGVDEPSANYVRGLDLSGSRQGAGGIGGLLARSDLTTGQTAYYYSDGNGNVRTMINSSNAIVAKYLYDAFGNILSKSGSIADANLYRFSSKEFHRPSGLVYYLYRYYDPNLQRWPNRDLIGEKGGINLYRFAKNAPTRYVDALGNVVVIDPTAPDSFKINVLNALNALLWSRTGTNVLTQIIRSPTVVTIKPLPDNQVPAPDGYPGDPTGTIGLNDWPGLVNPFGPVGTDQFPPSDEDPPNNSDGGATVIAHEFAHLLGYDDPPEGDIIEMIENPIRLELGLPPRQTYDGLPIWGVF